MFSSYDSSIEIEPRCSHFGNCGGCRFQHLPYSVQLEMKEETIRSIFPGYQISSIIGCEDPWEWRNKMEFTFSQSKAGECFLGLLRKAGRGRVEDIYHCHIAPKWMSATLSAVRQWWSKTSLTAYFPMGNRGLLRTLTLREGMHTDQKLALLTIAGNEKGAFEPFKLEFLKILSSIKIDHVVLCVQNVQKGSPTTFEYEVLYGRGAFDEKLFPRNKNPLKISIESAAFFQPNSHQATRMYQEMVDLAELSPEMVLYDLYCGAGGIALFAAPFVKEVYGIELNEQAINSARKNAQENGISNAYFYQGDVQEVLKRSLFPMPDCLFIDPPRVGLQEKALKEVVLLNAPRIIYLSCNPKSQAKDCEYLIKEGYLIEKIQPIDQFPQTPHIENLILLTNSKHL